ncbi:dipeptide ABC transporter ATP-binding protein [Roseateles terrae]|uniref:Dipeptide transport system ATP-binding protein n=1 Tax=Roseateles terrae TaxID=431060 RepID=A0ABR6GUB0_9BURK|nr:dipeptide ABC transporter ATP-binding protein [Roseateles terrae]MBB3194834.1 dipeptide transport system ATP-binding protein [Roseateles terrae]OWQ85900.1 dipeptide ABC transporter ATP-binding protein [Roseateles terrae]
MNDSTRGQPAPIPSAPLLRAEGLTRHYAVSQGWFKPKATVRALEGVSFDLQPGRTLAVVGESGCGKSTLARALTLVETPTAGRLFLQAQDVAAPLTRDQRQALRRQVQMVFQNPYAALNPRKTIAATLAEPLVINTRLSAAERRERVETLAQQVGLRPEHLRRYPHMFSGGQRQRIAIARAMMLQPGIVVADEPTSALDLSIQAQILNLFMDLQQAHGTGYVFISHNLAVVEHVADDVMVMYLGRVVEHGPRDRLFAQPLHPYTQALISATPSLRAADRRVRIPIHGELPSPLRPPSGCAFHQRCPRAVARCAEVRPELRPVDGRLVACDVL